MYNLDSICWKECKNMSCTTVSSFAMFMAAIVLQENNA